MSRVSGFPPLAITKEVIMSMCSHVYQHVPMRNGSCSGIYPLLPPIYLTLKQYFLTHSPDYNLNLGICNRALAPGPVTVQSAPPGPDTAEDLPGDVEPIKQQRVMC